MGEDGELWVRVFIYVYNALQYNNQIVFYRKKEIVLKFLINRVKWM